MPTFEDFKALRGNCPGCGGIGCGTVEQYIKATGKHDILYGNKFICEPCQGTGNGIHLEEIKLGVPDGYRFDWIKNSVAQFTECSFPKRRCSDCSFGGTCLELHIPLPHKLGDIETYTCGVCGESGKFYIPENDLISDGYITCPNCNGSPEIKTKVISLDIKDKTLTVGRVEM